MSPTTTTFGPICLSNCRSQCEEGEVAINGACYIDCTTNEECFDGMECGSEAKCHTAEGDQYCVCPDCEFPHVECGSQMVCCDAEINCGPFCD
eukprot:486458_1